MTTTVATPPATTNEVGLFHVRYLIGGTAPGSVRFTVDLLVNTAQKRVSGFGRLTQATHPPLDLTTSLVGDYTYMAVMPPSNGRILVVATGYPVLHALGANVDPAAQPNVHLRVVLLEDWSSGTATFEYTSDGTNWHTIDQAPVKRQSSVPADNNGAGLGTVTLDPRQVTATYSNSLLTITASGSEDGVTSITIVEKNAGTQPPTFAVVGNHSPAIGMFPYNVEARFKLAANPGHITLATPTGSRQVPVTG